MINIIVEIFYFKVYVVLKIIEGVIWELCMMNLFFCLGKEKFFEVKCVCKKCLVLNVFFNDDFLLDILRIK